MLPWDDCPAAARMFSIPSTIEHRFGLAPLGPRDAAVNDLSTVFNAKPPS